MCEPEIIILCAAHINSQERSDVFYRMLNSQMDQTHLCHVYVSVSGLPVKYDATFKMQKYVTIYQQPEPKLSQFTHYHRLINTLFDNGIIKPNTYILFTDDDDEMHTNRNKIYYQILCEYNTMSSKVDVLHLMDSIIRYDTDTSHFIRKLDNEYIAYCVSGIVAKTLINILSPNTLNDYTCDILFRNLLMEWPWNTISAHTPYPVYYYIYSMFLPKS
jgi:hypothetical protein